MSAQSECSDEEKLPDFYETVADDLLEYVGPCDGVWLDVGSGAGALGLAVVSKSARGVLVLLDPDAEALRSGLAAARDRGLAGRVVAIVGRAESIPLPDESVDVVMSRGSIFFWQDQVQGVREVYRILRPGGKAMLGGGVGRGYPEWARREFFRQRRQGAMRSGPDGIRKFAETRSPARFRRIALAAGLKAFEVKGGSGLAALDPRAGSGIWLRLAKESQ